MKRLNNLENESRKIVILSNLSLLDILIRLLIKKPKSGVPNEDRNKNNEIIGVKRPKNKIKIKIKNL